MGQPIGAFFGYQTNGLFRDTAEVTAWKAVTRFGSGASVSPGQRRYVNVNGDGVIDANDRTVIGNPTPKFTGGWQNTVGFRGFELSTLVDGSYGNKMINLNLICLESASPNVLRDRVVNAWSPTNERSQVDNYTFLPNHAYLYSTWTSAYAVINRANPVIARVPAIPMDTTLRNRVVGEAKFLRALNYFNLVRLFGGVPIRTVEMQGLDSLRAPRNSADEVYALVVSDLQDAIKVLPASYSGADAGRATSGAAKTLLAKVLLQRGATGVGTPAADYQAALDLLRDVRATGGYALVTDYAFLFDMAHEVNSEVIFDIQNSRSAGVGGRLSNQVAPRNSNYHYSATSTAAPAAGQ